jgi:transposase
MDDCRVIGLDLGIASAHTAIVLDADGSQICRRRCSPTVESLSELETAALDGAPEGTRLEVVIEPTGPAWLPVAVFFGRRGHVVHRVASAKAADLRRFFSRHAKSNAIDAVTLARLAFVHPEGLRPVELPGAERASLDRRVRACDRLTRAAATHKRRIKDLVRSLLPMSPLTGDLTRADIAVLDRWADPNALLRAGKARVSAVIAPRVTQPPRHRARGAMARGGSRVRCPLRGRFCSGLRGPCRRGRHGNPAPAGGRGRTRPSCGSS